MRNSLGRAGNPAGVPRALQTRAVAALGIVLGVTLVYLPAVRCGFVNWDDGPYVYENSAVLSGLSLRTFTAAWTNVTFHSWAPLTTLSYLLDSTLFGTQPWGYHLTSVLLHAAAAGLLFSALAPMTGCPWRSAAATLLFALHPLRVESVAWVAERKDVLSVFFLAFTLVAYERYCRRPSPAGYAAVAAAMTASLLSKSTLVTLPALLVLVDYWPLQRLAGVSSLKPLEAPRYPTVSLQTALLEKLPLLAVAGVFAAVTLATQAGAIKQAASLPLLTVRLPLGLWSIVRYLGMSLWPVGLHPAYCHPGAGAATWPVFAAALAGVCALAGVAASTRRSLPAVFVGLAWFTVSLAPVIGIVAQQGFQSHADRFTYVPHIGLAVAVVWLGAEAARRLPGGVIAAGAMLAAVLAAFIVADERQIAHWRGDDTLWQWILSVDPGNYVANRKQGHRLVVEQKDYDAGRRCYLAALGWLEQAGELDPGEAGDVCARLAHVEFDTGNHALARRYRDRALAEAADGEYTQWVVKHMRVGPRRDPAEAAKPLLRAGLADARAGQLDAALAAFEEALAADPECAEAANNLGLALAERGRKEDAAESLARAVALNPLNADYRLNLAQALAAVGNLEAAVTECRMARELDPTDAGIRNVERSLVGGPQ